MKKFVNKALAGALSLAMVLGMTAVVSPETASAKKVKVKKVTVKAPSGKTAYVAKGKKVKLTTTVKVTPNKKANKKVTYKSANKKIAAVNSKGYIKGVKAGKTKITVVSKKNKKKKATIKVIVKKAAVKKVTLNAKKATLALGAKKTLKAKVSPTKNVCTKVVWTSSNKKVATVTSKGSVKGVGEGVAKITAKAVDGSGKKATCTVTVGAGIKDVMVPDDGIVRVSLTSAKALTAADFTIQNKKTPSGAYTTTLGVEKVNSNDGGKTYDVVLDNQSSVMSYSYVKVTINKLATDRTKEIYVGNVPNASSYGVTDTITRVTGKVGQSVDDDIWFGLQDVGSVGVVKYSITGLPEGLKAYISKDGTEVTVMGKYKKVENGTTAVLTGVDETGKTFKRSYAFYIGDENTIVGNFVGDTVLAYQADDPNTKDVDEGSGFDFEYENIVEVGDGVIAGGSGDYEYSVTGLPAQVDTCSIEGELGHAEDANGNYAAVPAADYNVIVTVKDAENPARQAAFPFKLSVIDGVTLTGTVKDASGAPAKNIEVYGRTKKDAYGNDDVFSAYTKADGTYKARVIPGEYAQMTYFGGAYNYSTGNVYTAGTAVKDYTLPLYKVTVVPAIAGAAGYSNNWNLYVYDVNGTGTIIRYDRDDYYLYTYLKAGTYEFSSAYENEVSAYAKVETYEYGKYPTDFMGDYSLSGSFAVAGTGAVQVAATPIAD